MHLTLFCYYVIIFLYLVSLLFNMSNSTSNIDINDATVIENIIYYSLISFVFIVCICILLYMCYMVIKQEIDDCERERAQSYDIDNEL